MVHHGLAGVQQLKALLHALKQASYAGVVGQVQKGVRVLERRRPAQPHFEAFGHKHVWEMLSLSVLGIPAQKTRGGKEKKR